MKKAVKKCWQNTSDGIMINVMSHLVSDLAACSSLEGESIDAIHRAISYARRSGSVSDLRVALDQLPLAYNLDPYTFKVICQIKNFLKRYIFTHDLFSEQDLRRLTFEKFLEVQERIGCRHELKFSTKLVLQHARKIVKRALGPLDTDEWLSSGRFSGKACFGFPTPKSYLHDKIANKTTGSLSHQRYLFSYFTHDDSVVGQMFVNRFADHDFVVTDTLDYHQVPKTFKINRGMMPNTLAGSLSSSGLADMITRRLHNVGIDLSRQPEFHKVLAKRSSVSRSLVTADLSSASDTFTSELINRLVPRAWFNALNEGRAKFVRNSGVLYSLQSFMAMGIGYTFPLQTLLYYAIIKAVQELHGSRGTISVFGDDLIYPRGIHKFVVSVLTDCKFRMNEDKTFVHPEFRESCGGDYYRGFDVRPCSPEGKAERLGRWDRAMFLHKIANGLTARWNEHELPSTLLYITRELAGIAPLMYIPEDFPDYSGLKRISKNVYLPTVTNTYSHKLYACVFTCLLESPKKRAVPSLVGYYWDRLRQKAQDELYGIEAHDVIRGIFPRAIPRDLYSTVVETVSYVRTPRDIRMLGYKPKFYKSRVTRRREVIWLPTVPDKQAKPIVRVRQAVSILAS